MGSNSWHVPCSLAVLQLVLMVTILPFSRNAYRRANAALTNSYWSQLVWLTEWWGCLKVRCPVAPCLLSLIPCQC